MIKVDKEKNTLVYFFLCYDDCRRKNMSKNNMRTPKEKEKNLKEFYLGKLGRNDICRKYNIPTRTLADWRIKYEKSGIDGLKSNTGKSKGGNKGLGLRKEKLTKKN